MSSFDKSDRALAVITCLCIAAAPFTVGLSIGFLFLIFCMSSSSRHCRNSRAILDDAMVTAKLYEIEADGNEDPIDSYMLPPNCPSCGAPLRLDEVDWIDSKSALCPRCEAIIGVIVV